MSEERRTTLRTPGLRGHLLLPILMFVFGSLVSAVTWWQVRQDMQSTAAAGLADLAEESRGTLQDRVEKHLSALRNLSRYWQLFGLQETPVWHFNTGMVTDNFPGITWIAWIPVGGDSVRYVARDSSWTPSAKLVSDAVEHLGHPGPDVIPSADGVPAIHVMLPVRTPDLEVGTLAAEIRPDSLFGESGYEIASGLAFTVRTDEGHVLFRRGTPAVDPPAWLRKEVKLALSAGGTWVVDFEPTEEYVARSESVWPQYVLLTGLLLSLGIGAIALQILRVRSFSNALAHTNESLDARVHELTERDQELRHLNEDLESRVELRTGELRDAMTELEAFSHSISHDLRSPIGAVVNYVSILHEDYADRLDDEGRKVLQRIRKSSESAIALLDDLVQLARAGRDEPVREHVVMREVASRAFQEAVSADEEPARVQFELGVLPDAWGDPALIGRVFTNLFSNALKYTREREERRIRVSGSSDGSENTYVVEDNGVGFEPEASASVFEPFTRLHSSRRFQGTGLGLAIVARIVRRLGGRVAAESDGEHGARFTFTLPTLKVTP